MTSLSERCSVVIVPYNHAEYIEACIDSVLCCNPKEVLVVDGGSTDGTRELVRDMASPVELITMDGNPGYGGCNNVGVERASGEYVLILNPDTRLDRGAIEALLTPFQSPESGPTVTVPKILTYDGSVINTCGNINHITGLAFVQGFGDPPDTWSDPMSLTAISGACFAIRRSDFTRLGGFDDTIFLYMDDVELSWRLNSLNESIHYVPSAVVYHDYDDVDVDETKLHHLELGRYLILKKYLSKPLLVRLLPSLLMAELLTLGYAVLLGAGGVRAKVDAIRAAATTDISPGTGDPWQLIRSLDTEIPEGQLGDFVLLILFQKVANVLFQINAKLL